MLFSRNSLEGGLYSESFHLWDSLQHRTIPQGLMLRVLLPLASDWVGLQVHFHRTISSIKYFCLLCGFFVWLVFNSRKQINVYKRYYEEIFELLMALLSPLKSIRFSSCITGNSTHKQPYSVLTLIVLRTFLNSLLQRIFWDS